MGFAITQAPDNFLPEVTRKSLDIMARLQRKGDFVGSYKVGLRAFRCYERTAEEDLGPAAEAAAARLRVALCATLSHLGQHDEALKQAQAAILTLSELYQLHPGTDLTELSWQDRKDIHKRPTVPADVPLTELMAAACRATAIESEFLGKPECQQWYDAAVACDSGILPKWFDAPNDDDAEALCLPGMDRRDSVWTFEEPQPFVPTHTWPKETRGSPAHGVNLGFESSQTVPQTHGLNLGLGAEDQTLESTVYFEPPLSDDSPKSAHYPDVSHTQESKHTDLSKGLLQAAQRAPKARITLHRMPSGDLQMKKRYSFAHLKKKRVVREQQVDQIPFFDPPKIAAHAVMKKSKTEIEQNHKINAFHSSQLEEFLNPIASRVRPEMDAQMRVVRDGSREVRKDDKLLESLPGPDDSEFTAQTYINCVYFSPAGHRITEQRKKDGLPYSVPAGMPPSSACTANVRGALSMASGTNRAGELPHRPSSATILPKCNDADKVSDLTQNLQKSLSKPVLAKAAQEIAEKQKRQSFANFTATLHQKETKKFGSMLHNDLKSIFALRRQSQREELSMQEIFSEVQAAGEALQTRKLSKEPPRKSLHCMGGSKIERTNTKTEGEWSQPARVFRHSHHEKNHADLDSKTSKTRSESSAS